MLMRMLILILRLDSPPSRRLILILIRTLIFTLILMLLLILTPTLILTRIPILAHKCNFLSDSAHLQKFTLVLILLYPSLYICIGTPTLIRGSHTDNGVPFISNLPRFILLI